MCLAGDDPMQPEVWRMGKRETKTTVEVEWNDTFPRKKERGEFHVKATFNYRIGFLMG